MKITKEDLHNWWSKNETIRHDKKLYKVHKMSYGDYFLEPANWKGGEKYGFSNDTKWFKKCEDNTYKLTV